jgi:hypothetical protein
MTVESLRAALDARPFVPFTITTTAGQTYRVPSPEFAHYTRLFPRTLVLTTTDGGVVVFDVFLIPTYAFDPVETAGAP